jgi:hypothetical protein
MPAIPSPLQLSLDLNPGSDLDAAELDRLTRSLRREVQELAVESVELVATGSAPRGAKSADATMLGALTIAVLPVVVPKLIDFLQSWTTRSAGRTVKVKLQQGDRVIEVECGADTASRSDMTKLVDALAAKLIEPGKNAGAS